MKKMIAFALAAVMLFGLCACAPSGGNETTEGGNAAASQLMVGYGKEQIDPTESVPMGGYGSSEERMSTGMKSHLYQIALAVTDADGNTSIMIASDALLILEDVATEIREKISKECDVPVSNVIISALHQHSTPDMWNSKAPSGRTYRDEVFIPGAVKAAKKAMENRAPATVQTTSVQTEAMTFVRHYLMEDGTYAGNNFGDLTKPIASHSHEADETMQLIKFVREGQTTMNGKEAKNILLTNFQGHPIMMTSKDSNISSDVVGEYRDGVEKKLDCHSIYFSGALGNMLFTSKIAEENITSDYKDHAKALLNYTVKAEGTYTDVALSSVKVKQTTFVGNCYHGEDYRLSEANAAWAEFQKTNLLTNVAEGNKWFQAKGFNSRYHCTAIISHAKLPATQNMELTTVALGPVAFVAAPYEMFCNTGMYIKENSPFDMTVIMGQANDYHSYMPIMDAWDYDCYEKNQSYYERGTAEALAEEFLSMLNDLHGQY